MEFCTLLSLPSFFLFFPLCPHWCWVMARRLRRWEEHEAKTISLVCFVKMHPCPCVSFVLNKVICYYLDFSILFFYFEENSNSLFIFILFLSYLNKYFWEKKKSLLYSQNTTVPPAVTSPSRVCACGTAVQSGHRSGLCPYFIIIIIFLGRM